MKYLRHIIKEEEDGPPKSEVLQAYTNLLPHEARKYKDIIMKQKDYLIFRGMETTAPFILGQGELMRRRASEGFNYVNIMLSEILDSWKEYPRRDQSFICTTSHQDAMYYTSTKKPYRVFPLENQLCGLCPKEDLWYSFSNLISEANDLEFTSLNRFQIALNNIIATVKNMKEGSKVHFTTSDRFDANAQQVRDVFDSLTNDLKTEINRKNNLIKEFIMELYPSSRPLLLYIVNKLKSNNTDVLSILDSLLDPATNGFKLIKPEYTTSISGKREIWMSGKVLFIHEDYIDAVFS